VKGAVKAIESILDPLCIAEVPLNAKSRVKVKEFPVAERLMRAFAAAIFRFGPKIPGVMSFR
jgi:hypothetical protein